jgi:hypothetical protein
MLTLNDPWHLLSVSGRIMLPILIPPNPRRSVDFAAAHRVDERDAQKKPIELDEHGRIIDDLEDRRRRWRRRCGLSKILVVRTAKLSEKHFKFVFPATLDSCESVVRSQFRRKLLALPRAARIDIAPLLDYSLPVTVPAGKISSDAVASLLWESNWRGLSTFRQVPLAPMHVQTLTVKWWMSSAQSLRFGPAEDLLNELRDCVRNVYRFWQCVAQRMKPYDFYFLDPRLVSIEFRSSDQRKRRQVDND